MKVLALIRYKPRTLHFYSGGKDSCFNIIKCQEAGHEVVALAHLHPPAQQDELDSYMYQSVGHDAIALMATECWGLPLYRAEIGGKPVNLAADYAPTEGDEVEDLYRLVQRVLQVHPDIGGISSGAIWSSYQRVRVENVCARLGLVSLANLWGREQSGLLQEMIDSGIEAILIKVAAMGNRCMIYHFRFGECRFGKDLGASSTQAKSIGQSVGD